MAELGVQTEALHIELGRAVAEAGVDLLLTVGESTKASARAAQAARHDLETICFDETDSLCDNLRKLIRDHDTILVKGSRTARLEKAVEKLRELHGQATSPRRIEEMPASRARRQAESIKDREQG